jgi:hypothetical protein
VRTERLGESDDGEFLDLSLHELFGGFHGCRV